MRSLVLSVLVACIASPALAFGHGGAPAGASLFEVVYLEVECLLTTSWLVLQLVVQGNWFMLSNLDGICATSTNSMFFSNPYVAVATAFALLALLVFAITRSLIWVNRSVAAMRQQLVFSA